MGRLRESIVALVLLPIAAAACSSASGQPGAPVPQAASESSRSGPGDGLKPFDELTEGAVAREGFFDTYQKGSNLWLAVPRDRLGEDFLLSFEISRGIGAGGVFGGTMLNIFEGSIVAFERHGDRVFLVQRPHRFVAPGDPAAAKAVELTFGESVLASAKIESVRADSALVIDVHDWLVSDLSGVSERVNDAISRPGREARAAFDKDRSWLASVKAFPENLNLEAQLTFRSQQPASLPSVPDGRYIPVGIHYSFAKLPERPMQPRLADDRVGYFMTVHKDFSSDDGEDFFVRYVNRWRLEPKGPAGPDGLVEPVEPIVYYLDHTIPEEYRPYIEAGVEAWNRAYEAAGWKNAIRAEPLPEGADPEDLRYATIRWNVSDRPGYGAIGPSIVDPRTGEILDADILIEHNMILGFKRDWRTKVSPGVAIEQMLSASPEELAALAAGGEATSLGAALAAQGATLRAVLTATGEIAPGEPVPMEYVGQALKWVTMHEVGHTLGLRHNFRSSADTPLERLDDAAWARERGVFSSVMEYPSVNLDARGTDAPYYNPGVGSYDLWAISYGYTPDPARAAALARDAAKPGHAYGTDEDARGPGALDPTVNVYDLGADPLAWGMRRAELIASLWPTLPSHVLEDNARYAELTDAYRTLLSEYGRALATAVKYIGGQYQYRDHVGDPDARPPFVNVPKSRQREALEFLRTHAFDEDAFALPREVLARFGANRWSHWGETNTWDGRIDFPLLEQVLGLQTSLLEQLTNAFVFARIRDAELKYGAGAVLTVPELMEGLTRSIWSEVWSGGARPIPAIRRDLQRAYLDRMTEILVTPPSRMPADARAVARMRLVDLERRIAARVGARGLDDYTRAHLLESRARIAKALEAGLVAEQRP
ncbi:MAG TPA: zinc-dependent metalloprotease [Longimicrobiales bacterium]